MKSLILTRLIWMKFNSLNSFGVTRILCQWLESIDIPDIDHLVTRARRNDIGTMRWPSYLVQCIFMAAVI